MILGLFASTLHQCGDSQERVREREREEREAETREEERNPRRSHSLFPRVPICSDG